MSETRLIAVVCRDRSQFSRWVHQRNSGETLVRAEKLDTVYHCVTYGCAVSGRRFHEILVVEQPRDEKEVEWLREFRLLHQRPI